MPIPLITALKFLFVMLAAGGGVALATAMFVVRARLCARLLAWTMLLGGPAFTAATLPGDWAGSHASIENGRRADFSPTGEDLRLRNWLVWLQLPMATGAAAATGVVIGLGFRRKKIP